MTSKKQTIKIQQATIEQLEDQLAAIESLAQARLEDNKMLREVGGDVARREQAANARQRQLDEALRGLGYIKLDLLNDPAIVRDEDGKRVDVSISDARIVKQLEDKLAADRKPKLPYAVGGYTGFDAPLGVHLGLVAGHRFVPGVHPGILGDWIEGSR